MLAVGTTTGREAATVPAAEAQTPEAATGWGHVPGLDGVRGIAVLAVLLFHGGVSWARGGFLGVDAFFVLSGLLITSLLLDESGRTGSVDLGRFWARRARRLLPALLAVVAASAVYGALFSSRGGLGSLRRDAIATLLYAANWRFIEAGANYFEATAAPSVLRHTWSLAIEEQFYLLWPVVVFAIARRARRRPLTWVAVVAGGGVAASAWAMWALFEPGGDPSRAYFGTDSRVQVVLTGAVLAAVLAALRRRPRPLGRPARALLAAGAATGAAAFLAAAGTAEGTETALFRGGFLAISVAVALVLAHIVLVPRGWSARLLSWAPLRALGLVSYGLYLWHWPVFLTLTRARTGLEGGTLLAAKLAVTGVLAIVSYVVIERPIRRGALPGVQAALALPAAMTLVAAAVFLGTTPPAPARLAVGAPARTESGFPVSRRPARPIGAPVRVLVVGDSVAKTLADRHVTPARRAGLAMVNRGVLGCGVVRGSPFRYFGKQQNDPRGCADWPRQWSGHIARDDPDVVLAIVGRWEVMDRVHQGRWTQLGDPAFDRYVEAELERAVEILSAGDATVAFATAPYFLRGERPDGGRWPEDDPARVDRFNTILRSVVARHPDRTALLDLNAQTSRGGQYTPVVDGVSLRFDGVHFSPEGARWLQPWLFAALLEMGPPERGGARRPGTSTSLPSLSPATTGRPRPAATSTTAGQPTSTSTTEPPPSSTTTTPTTEPPTTTSTPDILPG